MANVTRLGKKLKEEDRNPPNTRKSGRLDSHKPLSCLFNRKSKRVEKESPLRRSEKGESHRKCRSLISAYKKTDGDSITWDTRKKKEEKEKSGRKEVLEKKEQSKSDKGNQERVRVVLRMKRLDARTYRSSFKPQAKKVQKSGLDEKHRGLGNFSLEVADNLGTSGSKEVEEGADERSGKRGDEPGGKYSGEGAENSVERPGSGSRNLAHGALEGDDLACFSRKRKVCMREAPESKCRGISLSPKFSDSLAQSSPDESMQDLQNNINDACKTEVGCSRRGDTPTPELILSTSSKGRILASDVDLETIGNVGDLKRRRNSLFLESDVSVTATEEFCTREITSADAISSSPSVSMSRKFIIRCSTCFKQRRVSYDSQNQAVCSCNGRLSSDLCDIALYEGDAPSEVAMLGTSENDVIVGSCFLKDRNKENLGLDATQELTEAQKVSVHGITLTPTVTNILVPVDEDRGTLEVNSYKRINEEYDNSTQIKKPSLDIETDSDLKSCVICKLGGELLCCDGKGCRKSYHLSCLDPPLNNVPYGVWHCLHCVKKKIEFGVHSVCEGLESIWDAREREVLGIFGMQREKEYLVKYKGLAHVHNQWIPEKKILQEDPLLVAKFNRKHQKKKVVRWKSEWTVPQRLLQKRLLMSQRQADEYFSRNSSDCRSCLFEWFVKWNGLGYDHATWELENASFLCSPEGMMLIRDHENRHEKAKKASDPQRGDKLLLKSLLQERESSFPKLQNLASGFQSGKENETLNSVNNLFDYWHKHQSVVVIDDQERILKVILFILSLQSYVCRPFLIISTSSALPIWENELLHLAPSVNVVVYSGNKDVRKCIQTLEFYEEGGCVMLEVLLSPSDAVFEDLERLEWIGWEAIIIDECQHSRVSRHFNQIRKLTSEFRLLFHNGPMKESIPEYLNLLTFLDQAGDGTCVNSLNIDSNDNSGAFDVLKERLAKFLVCERKLDSKFVEFWVPVRLSKVQLEQYCSTLLSNSISLCSCSKFDPNGALRDILISLRKCCDHPYLVDASLQSTLTKCLPEIEYLDVGVNASGKLQLLDKILAEIKNRGLRVLILFQSIGGSGRNSIGDILDDFLRQRFGPDCYERVDVGLFSSKKQAALNMFNDKKRGRFVFLIENRACLPSIKLSAVDIVIIFDSDWNPFNDIRALQKISIDSQFEQLKVFRFYSSCTVEEKVLIFAKQDMAFECNIRNINRSASQMLLTWGASYLFNKLDEFHSCTSSNLSSSLSDLPLLKDVVSELLAQLPHGAETNNTNNCSVILEIQHCEATYPKNVSLLGELEMHLTDEELPHVFWSRLLEGRYPLWRYLSGSSQRARKKVQHFDELLKEPAAENNDSRRKRKKIADNSNKSKSPQTWLEDKRKIASSESEATMADTAMITQGPSSRSYLLCPKESPGFSVQMNKESGASLSRADFGSQHSQRLPANMDDQHGLCMPPTCDISELRGTQMIEPEGRRKLFDAQKNLHLLLKPTISKLCETLQLPEDVEHIVGKFLDYIIYNHCISQESETILQAFQISLCWMAASLLKHKLDRKKSLVVAKEHLNFNCKEEEVESVYSRLRVLKKRFSCRTAALLNTSQGHSFVPRNANNFARNLMQARALKSSSSNQQELEGEIRESSQSRNSSDKQVSVEQAPDPMQASALKSSSSNQPELEGEIREISPSCNFSDKHVSVVKEPAPDGEIATRLDECDGIVVPLSHVNENVSRNNEVFKICIRRIKKVCARRARKILSKQHEELTEFMNYWEREKEKLKKAHRLESDIIFTIHHNASVRSDKLKKTDEYFAQKMDELETRMETFQREIVAKQQDARKQEKRIKAGWLDTAKYGRLSESFAVLPLTDSGFRLERMVTSEWNRVCSENAMLISRPSSEPENANATILDPVELIVRGGISTETPEMVPNEAPEGILTETISPAVHSIIMNAISCGDDGMGNAALERGVKVQVDKNSRANNADGVFSMSAQNQSQIDLHSSTLACISPSHDNMISSHQPPSEPNQLLISAGEESERIPSCAGRQDCTAQIEVSMLQPTDAIILQLEKCNDDLVSRATVQLQLHPSADVVTGEHNQPNTSAAVQSEPEPDLQLQAPSSTNVSSVEYSQPVTAASIGGEPEPVLQLPMTLSTVVLSVECNQLVTSPATGIEPEPVVQLQLISSTDVTYVRPNQPDTSAVTASEADTVMPLELPPLTGLLSAEADSTNVSSVEYSQPVTAASTGGEPEPVLQLLITSSTVVPSVEYNQLVISHVTGIEPEPVVQLQLISSTDVPSVRSNQPDTSAFTVSETDPVMLLELPLSTGLPSAETDSTNVSSVEYSQPVTVASIGGEPEPVLQLLVTSSTVVRSVECNQLVVSPATGVEPEPVVELQLISSTDVPSVRSNQPDTSAVTVSETDPVMQLELPPSTGLLSAECDRVDTSAIESRNEPELGSERCSSSQPTVGMQQPIESIPSQIEQFHNLVSESNVRLPMPVSTDMPLGGMPMEDPVRTRLLPESTNPTPPYMTTRQSPMHYLDPFQNELAKLRMQEEQIIRMHEDTKTRFTSECEKEIEELRQKYNGLIQDTEKAFVETKKMLEVYSGKVHLNMILAETFKIKCTNAKPSGRPSRPGLSSTIIQPQTTQRSPRSPAPPIQVVHHSSALFSSNPLAPESGTVIPRVNFQIGSELRASPPHLQPFRPSMLAPGLSPPLSGIPSQVSLNHHMTGQPLPPQLWPQPPSYPSGAFKGTVLPVSSSALSTIFYPSAPELLMDVGNRSGSNLLPLLSESNFDTLLPSGQTTVGSRQGNIGMDSMGPVTDMDVVCLSDDD